MAAILARVISLRTGKMATVLAKAIERTNN